MLHIIEHTLLDSVKLVPFLFLTYLAMEYLEHKARAKTAQIVRKAGKWGPIIGGIAGVVPQCGFSAAASNLYAGRVISLGTLLAIYLSTSDEMLPILISERAPIELMVQILVMKAAIGILAGFVIDALLRQDRMFGNSHQGQESYKHNHEHESDKHSTHAYNAHLCEHSHDHADREQHIGHSHADGEHNHGHAHNDEHYHIHEICEQDHCNCERDGVFLSALKHTLKIFFFIVLITLGLNVILHTLGEEILATLILDRPILGPILAGVVGLVPNCAASVVITQLFLEGVIGLGAMMAGLLVGAGVGLVVLFRVNHHRKENFKILGLLYLIGVTAGIIIEIIM